MFIVKDGENATIFYDKEYVESLGLEYFEVSDIPEGGGMLKTDGKTLWWEEITPEKPSAEELEQKYNEISLTAENMIYEGFKLETTAGTETFSLTDQDQSNIIVALKAVEAGAEAFPYHANKTLCRLFSADEIKAISAAATYHTLYHTTYCNHIFRWLERITTKEELDSIYYGARLPDDLYQNMMTIIDSVSEQNEVILNNEGVLSVGNAS